MLYALTVLFILSANTGFGEAVRQGKIVGGEDVDISKVPYQVSIIKGFGHNCGGSIISKDLILTAAHCVIGSDPVKDMQVRVGSNSCISGGTIFDIESAKYHQNFTYKNMDYDVAVLKLKRAMTFGPNVAPIKVVDKNFVVEEGVEAVVSGWGKTKETGSVSKMLKRVSVPLIKQEDCALAYEHFQPLTERMLCAGVPAGGKDACQGDSGGPLAVKGQLVGVVSWGIGCARPSYPGVYTRLSALDGWIRDAVAEMSREQ